MSLSIELQLHKFLNEKSLALSSKVGNRKLIYLDVNFWIRLRKGKSSHNKTDKSLFEIISKLFKTKKCLFPISELTFWEIMKQADLKSRSETVSLVDELSEGICISNTEERIITEIATWFSSSSGKKIDHISHLIWSNINVVVAYKFIMRIPDGVLQQMFIEFLSKLSLGDVLQDKLFFFSFKDNVEQLNYHIKKHTGENKTFQDMFLSELGGFIDEHSTAINNVMSHIYFNETGLLTTEEEQQKTDHKISNMIYNFFKLGKISNQLPVFHILPSLFAWSRWINKDFKDGNDTIDFLHATVALPYCDYFFTDRRLVAGISELKLDKTYNCITEYKLDKVINHLNNL